MSIIHDETVSLRKALHNALREWATAKPVSGEMLALRIVQQASSGSQNWRHAVNQVILDALEQLDSQHPDDALLLRERFLDGDMALVVGNRRNISQSVLFERQKVALDRLTHIVVEMEKEAMAAHHAAIERLLPYATVPTLVGIEARVEEVVGLLQEEEQPWVVSLEGIGGIGKSSLAASVARRMMLHEMFDGFAWVSAQQQLLDLGAGLRSRSNPSLTVEALVEQLGRQLLGPAHSAADVSDEARKAILQSHLHEQRCLIVIDNLETVQDIDTLLPTISSFVNPSKFLLTSRESLYPHANLVRIPVAELPLSDACDLVRREAQQVGMVDLSNAANGDLLPIYQAVGGNPLALRLVVGQSYFHGLATVLEDLTRARGRRIEELYRFIYRQAWEKLDEKTRRVFLVMPLISDQGGDLSFIEQISGVDDNALRLALEHLIMANLIDVKGTMDERYYTIHNLTRTFLHEEIAKWQ